MKKETYDRTALEIIRFRIGDVIMTGLPDPDYEDDETKLLHS